MSHKYLCSSQRKRTLTDWRALQRLLLTQKHRTTKITCTVLISRYCTTDTKNISTKTQWRCRLHQLHLPQLRQTDKSSYSFQKRSPFKFDTVYTSFTNSSKEQGLLTLSPNHRLSTKQDTNNSCCYVLLYITVLSALTRTCSSVQTLTSTSIIWKLRSNEFGTSSVQCNCNVFNVIGMY
jgi:hypothetical protein